jgi:hypothetical protein
MSGQPFYHLRPNKYIDRHLFIQALSCLNKSLSIPKYKYIGFGSYQFDDFKAIHSQLGISDMVSLENDRDVWQRANFNKPYNCIEIIHDASTSYITDNDFNKPVIIWLDFTDPKSIGSQFADFCATINKMDTNDLIRITLNANPSSLGGKDSNEPKNIHDSRFQTISERIGGYMPSESIPNCMTANEYPLFLLRCLKKAASQALPLALPYQKKYLLPLFSSVYKDGQQMATLTAIVQEMGNDNTKHEERIRDSLSVLPYITFDWENPTVIHVPALTQKEILHINGLLPAGAEEVFTQHEFMFDNKAEVADNYAKFYKYYPNFHHVSL